MPVLDGQFQPTGQRVLADELFDFLKEQISSGALRPGERLVEEQIGQATSLSRTPVREALRRLKAAGLADNRGRSFVVTALNSGEQREAWVILEYLSGLAARLAAEHCTEIDLTGLRLILEHASQAIESDNLSEIIHLNRQFHDTVNQASANRTLAELIGDLTLRLERGTDFAQARRRKVAHEEHESILEALVQRDPDAAERAVQTHLRHQLVAAAMPQLSSK